MYACGCDTAIMFQKPFKAIVKVKVSKFYICWDSSSLIIHIISKTKILICVHFEKYVSTILTVLLKLCSWRQKNGKLTINHARNWLLWRATPLSWEYTLPNHSSISFQFSFSIFYARVLYMKFSHFIIPEIQILLCACMSIT